MIPPERRLHQVLELIADRKYLPLGVLQRVVNGAGRIQREYGLGRGALDVLIEWKDAQFPIEVKTR